MTPTKTSMAERHREQSESNARKLGALETEVSSLKADVGQIRNDMRSGFDAIFGKLDRVSAPKPMPWGAVTVCLTMLLALATWGNSWVSQAINGVQQAAAAAAHRAGENEDETRHLHGKVVNMAIDDAEYRGATNERLRWIENAVKDAPHE